MNRTQLKKLSKSQLKGHWKVPVLLTLMYAIIVLAISLSENYLNSGLSVFLILIVSLAIDTFALVGFPNFYLKFINNNEDIKYADFLVNKNILLKSLGYGIFMALIGAVCGVIIGLTSVSMITYNMFGYVTFSASVLPFILFMLALCIILIIFSLAISQTTYLLVDKEDIKLFEAIGLSIKMMKGYKWEFFVLYLSFIGWAMLAILTFGIAYIWLYPYIALTCANFYKQLDANYHKVENISEY